MDSNLFNTLNRLVYKAEYENEKNGYVADLKFELGVEVVTELHLECMHYIKQSFPNPKRDEKIEIMGIPVEINYQNPRIIRLWKEVKD